MLLLFVVICSHNCLFDHYGSGCISSKENLTAWLVIMCCSILFFWICVVCFGFMYCRIIFHILYTAHAISFGLWVKVGQFILSYSYSIIFGHWFLFILYSFDSYWTIFFVLDLCKVSYQQRYGSAIASFVDLISKALKPSYPVISYLVCIIS